jgi:copper chaperone CopZ
MKVSIRGMTCAHCATSVARALARVPGVLRVADVNLARGEATIEGAADPARLLAAIDEEEYQGTLLDDGEGAAPSGLGEE